MQDFEKAWEKVSPIVTPVIPEDRDREKRSRASRFHVIGGGLRKIAIVINDVHIPFEDKAVVRQTLNAIRDIQPDTVILNGDILDAYSLSRFVKSAKRRFTFNDEVVATKKFLDAVRDAAPDAVIHFTEGNHETRLRRYLDSDATALADLPCLEWDSLLGLAEREILWHGTAGFKLNRSFLVLHGDRISKHVGASARMEFERHLSSGISGHTHRAGRYDIVGHSADFNWVENGCLCQMNPEYVSGKPNWQQAISIIEYNRDRTHTRLVQIMNRHLVIDGRSYRDQ